MFQQISSFALVAFLLTSNAAAHVKLSNPVPWTGSITSPLGSGGGGTFPCQGSFANQAGSQVNKIAVGEKQTMTFDGSAVHGGGSCQISISTNIDPSKDENVNSFYVIQSMEGGCPLHSFDFTLPDSVPNGKVTLAWTWFPAMSGGLEIYMNCATVQVSGGASDDTKLKQLPKLFVANDPDAGGNCEANPNVAGTINVEFPNPGQNVIKSGAKLTPPTGNCGGSSGSGSGSGSDSSASPVASSPAASTPAASTPVASTPVGSSPAASNTGGVFAPGASSAPAGSAGAGTSFTTVIATTTAAAPLGTAPASTPAASPAPSSGTGSGTGSNGSTCDTPGKLLCNGTKMFGLCTESHTVTWQAVAAGTTCENGAISKRSSRIYRRGRIMHPREGQF